MPDTSTTVADAEGTAAAPSATDDALKALASLSVDPANTVGPPQAQPLSLGLPAPATPVPSPTQAPGTPPGMTPPNPAEIGASGALDAIGASGAGQAAPSSTSAPTPSQQLPGGPQDPYGAAPSQAGMGIPQNPYAAQGALPTGKMTPEQAAQAENDAILGAAQTHTDALQSKVLSDREHMTAQAKVMSDYADALGAENNATTLARDAIHRSHAAENAQWMKDMTAAVNKEPDSGRWWEDQSSFSKVMWLMSLAFSAKAMAHGATKNTALDMIRAEIDGDVREQKERLTRQLDLLKTKGTLSAQDYAEKLSDLSSDHSARVARLMTIEKAQEARAAIPGAADLTAATMAGRDYLQKEMVGVAKDRYDKSVASAEADLTRRSAERRESIQLGYQDKWHNQEDKRARDLAAITDLRDRDLAQEKIDARIAAADKKGDKDDRLAIPASSGAMLVGPKGEQVQIKVPKEHAQKVSDSINDATQLASGIKYLQDKLQDTSSTDYLLKNENQFNSALAKVADKIMVQSGGKRGLSSEQVRDQVYQQLLGENYGSAWAKLKGKSREEVVSVLQHNLDQINPALHNELKSVAGSNLADLEGQGYHVGINMNDVRPMESTPHTPTQVLASMGVKSEVPHPQTGDEYRQAKARGDEFLPRLRPELETELTDAQKKWPTASPTHIREGFLDARSRISKWSDAAEAAAKTPEQKQAVHAQTEDALLRLSTEESDIRDKASKALDSIKSDLIDTKQSHDQASVGPNGKPWEPSVSDVKHLAERKGLTNLDPEDIVKLIEDVKHVRR